MSAIDDLIADIMGNLFEVRTTPPDPANPRRRDFDVPLPLNTRIWLARITREHHQREGRRS